MTSQSRNIDQLLSQLEKPGFLDFPEWMRELDSTPQEDWVPEATPEELLQLLI